MCYLTSGERSIIKISGKQAHTKKETVDKTIKTTGKTSLHERLLRKNMVKLLKWRGIVFDFEKQVACSIIVFCRNYTCDTGVYVYVCDW